MPIDEHAPLDASKYRPLHGGPSFSLINRATRAAWIVTWLLFAAWTPGMFRPWRSALLKLFGATIGPRSDVKGSARIWLPSNLRMGRASVLAHRVNCYNQALIDIGDHVVVSQGAHLCAGTHDYSSPFFQLAARPIRIEDQVWIAAEAFVGPGAYVEEGSILGARGVAFGRLDAWCVYAGNPAKMIQRRVVVRRS